MDITQLHDDTTGTYDVFTRNSVFTLNMDTRTVWRSGTIPLLASGQETFELARVVTAIVGRAMVLDVILSGRREPLTTSRVEAIEAHAPATVTS